MILAATLVTLQPAPAPADPPIAATQAEAGRGMRPEVEAAFAPARLAWLQCLRIQADITRRQRRGTNREAELDGAFTGCEGDENAMRAALRRQYDQASVDSLLASLRSALRVSLRTYLRR
jgi:hypothetical protein